MKKMLSKIASRGKLGVWVGGGRPAKPGGITC